jgi:serine/threonine-protein kinase
MVGAVSDWPTFDGIRIDRRLFTEGVIESYLAYQEGLGRKVIVKALRPNVLPASPFASALKREAQILGELCHEHIQRLYDFRCTDSQMWLVLEYLDGAPLSQVLGRLGTLPPLAVASMGFMIASALLHCHTYGTVHRTLSPQSLVIAESGTVSLIGFVGAVKDRLPTAPELLDGAPHLAVSPYYSPEQILGESVDARSDLFSLGVVLYEALTGQNPFAGPDEHGVAQRIRKDKVPPVSRFVRGVPTALERIIDRCLEKMPQDRFSSASELVMALEGLLREHDVVATEGELAKATRAYFAPNEAKQLSAPPPRAAQKKHMSEPLTAGLVGLLLGSVLIIAGGFVLQSNQAVESAQARRASGRLELLPDNAASLRVVVDPWATVSIDGQEIGTTPIGRPIPLSAGTHYVQLEHPRASIERRTVHLSVGETILLDVKMKVAPTADPTPQSNDLTLDASVSP